ncbi:RagB/SusD family nutrient uptake outer membrane protein [Chitinophaga caseinilytica]|uniref:RagB/SusD family nutrient uptake outer membrane protein n=1 Tax=Chitinophaga caseinilytica TaxID=2267521 RepID=A0ABZ2Z8X9_9BACT
MKSMIRYMFAGTLALGLATSCTKQLDISPEGTPTTNNFWKSELDAISGANAMYQPMDDENFYGRGYWWFINASDDMVTGRIKAEADNIKNFNRSFIGGSYTEGQWKMRYSVIKRANDVINRVPAIDMNDATKRRVIGEAYFMSGLMYFELATTYADDKAGVPIVRRDVPLDEKPIPRAANIAANWDYIESELKQASAYLPTFQQLAPADYGRPHKSAALGYLAKMYLYKKDWAKAEAYCDSLIGSGRHQLLDNFADVFTIANNWSSEYIWSAYSTSKGQGGFGSILPGVMLENKGWGKYNGWGYYMPTKELYDTYDPRDKRRAATILAPGDRFKFWGDSVTYNSLNSLSGYQFNKYMEPFTYADGVHASKNGDHPTTDLCLPLLRYAEIYLIKAEARLMQGKNADTELNALRKRTGLPNFANATLADLKKERRLELAGEWANRHADLVRWGDAQAAYAKPLHGASGAEIWPARAFDPTRHHIWPVPQSEIDNSGGIIFQNAGWK